MPSVTREQIVASALRAAIYPQPTGDKIPEGWFTVQQIGEQIGKTSSTVRRMLQRPQVKNSFESRSFRVVAGNRKGMLSVKHYRLK